MATVPATGLSYGGGLPTLAESDVITYLQINKQHSGSIFQVTGVLFFIFIFIFLETWLFPKRK